MTTFEAIYAEHVNFVWRNLRRLGVAPQAIEDAVQDVFIVVHRRLDHYRPEQAMRGWLFGITAHVAQNHRRRFRRKEQRAQPLDASFVDSTRPDPFESSARIEGVRALQAILDQMADKLREVFILAEVEELTAREIGEGLGLNSNTVSSRLRAARAHFNRLISRRRACGVRGGSSE